MRSGDDVLPLAVELSAAVSSEQQRGGRRRRTKTLTVMFADEAWKFLMEEGVDWKRRWCGVLKEKREEGPLEG